MGEEENHRSQPGDGVPEPASCQKCDALCTNRTQIVNGIGPIDADIVIVGEAPGATEDETGEPFVGRSGDVLTDALLRNGIHRHEVRITNTVRCKPPDNRDPTQDERGNCEGFLRDEIHAVDPVVVMPVGKIPSEQLLGEPVRITDDAGTPVARSIRGSGMTILPSLHPAATLYDPSTRDLFEETIRTLATLTGRTPTEQSNVTDY